MAADGRVALLTLWGKTSDLNILPVVYIIKCAKPTNDFNGQRCLNSTPGTTFEVTMHYLKIKNTMFRNHVKWMNLMLPSKYCKLISFNHSILASQYYTFSHNRQCDIIHKSCGFEGDIPEYQPRGDTKALARYVTCCRRQKMTFSARTFVSPRALLFGIFAREAKVYMLCDNYK